MKTKLEILQETITYIKENGRAAKKNDDGTVSCLYYTPTTCCAFGRCMKDDYKNEEFTEKHICHTAHCILNNYGFVLLKDEYRIESFDFWTDIQVLHDTEEHWEDKQLTQEGKKWYGFIVKKIADGRYEN